MATRTQTHTTLDQVDSKFGSLALRGSHEPLHKKGLLDDKAKFDFIELTPVIGRQYDNIQVKDLLVADNADELLRELAITVSERGVVIFKNQDLTIPEQTELGDRLGRLSGRPTNSGLHIHPVARSSELPAEISSIDSIRRPFYERDPKATSQLASTGWHSDITFEKVPSDFALLKVHTLPETGGDTLWASAYEAYDRLSPAYKKFLEGLTATHDANRFHDVAKAAGTEAYVKVRGNPLNDGPDYSAVHPVIRTNPVTGWKGLFVNAGFTKRINELSKDESDDVLSFLRKIIAENHDLQVRHRWGKNDLAIWSNTSTVHTATWDYGSERRTGDRVVSIGEKPFYDAQSKSRREALGLPSLHA
ncbi:hypothetical protein OIO90_002680 [Microbotryomycetes sp. JL221]|nr:hypothetical protein OIO90_002680 [Microbotryomycetes sp. JL221]